MRVAPRKARPFVPGRTGRFLIPEANRDDDDGPAQPGADEAPRRRCGHDPAPRHPPGRPRDPDRGLPAARRRRSGLPPRVGRGRRAPRPVLVPRRRAAPAARGPRRRRPDPDPAGHGPDLRPGPADRQRAGRRSPRGDPVVRAAPPGAAGRRDAAVHRRRRRGARLRRGLHLRADRPAPGARSRQRADGGLHRDRPRPGVRPPHPHPLRGRVAAHRDPRPRGPLPDRRRGDLRRARPRRAPVGGRDRRRGPPGRDASRGLAGTRRHEPRPRRVHPRRRGRQGGDRVRGGDPGRARPPPVLRPAGRPRDGSHARRDRAVPGAPPGQPESVPVLRADAQLRGRRRLARSSCSRSRATSSRRIRSPGRGRAVSTPARTRSWPSSSSATRRNGPST